MKYRINQLPLFEELSSSENILLAGAGGGFDIYAGIPLYINLINQGKKVILGNYAFTWLENTTSERVFPGCYKVKGNDRDLSGRNYFPEKYLKMWFDSQDEQVELYGFERTGVQPLREVYNFLIDKYEIDTVILIDGGTDSLMFGDEESLGTPQEDICSMAAVFQSKVKKQILVNIGFGVDHYHGVSHYRFLENVAEMSKKGGYLGMFQIMGDMLESKKYVEAVNYVNEKMIGMNSIVSNSIVSALENKYGNHHRTRRTQGSELWINPLMAVYWSFDLRKVVEQVKYYDYVKDTMMMEEVRGRIAQYRSELTEYRRYKQIPI